MLIQQYDCLTENECQNIRNQVHALRQHWVARMGEEIPFYTFGVASYIDGAEKGKGYYFMVSQRTNKVLYSNFKELYDQVAQVLGNKTGHPIAYAEDLALPGFHVFLYHELFRRPLASIHFDLQFDTIKWKYQNIDFKHPLSFTLPIALPHSGGGMYCWDIRYTDVKDLPEKEFEKRIETEKRHLIEYETGKLVVHDGLLPHQIAPVKDIEPEDERITLQGHGLVCDGVLQLYW